MSRSSTLAKQRLILISWAFAALSAVCGLIARGTLSFRPGNDPTVPQSGSFYFYTFSRFEPLALFALSAFFFVLSLVIMGKKPWPQWAGNFLVTARLTVPVALLVLVLAGVGRFVVHQNFDLCIDEALNDFQAQILARHHLVADVPEQWRAYEKALVMPYEQYNAQGHYWASGFLPGFALLDYLFSEVNLSWALSPVLGALSILLVASLAKRIFPSDARLAANLAVLLLATSPQFMAMAMTKFAWTSHLCGTLLWVWLFSHPNKYLFLLTPLLGAFMIGLHQPHVHPLVVLPFLLRLVYELRIKSVIWFAFCYLIGIYGWFQIMLVLRPSPLGASGELTNLVHPLVSPAVNAAASPMAHLAVTAFTSVFLMIFHGITALGWSAALAFPFVGLMVWNWKSQPPLIRDAMLGVCLTFAFYFTFLHNQGHGWGYRYLHGAYGLLILVAVAGALTIYRAGAGVTLHRIVLASCLFSIIVQFPYRCFEIRTLVRPLALTWNYIAQQKTDFVVLRTTDFWYSWDIIRNDPWLERRPIVLDGTWLSPAQLQELHRRGTVHELTIDEVKPFGVILSDPAKTVPQPIQ